MDDTFDFLDSLNEEAAAAEKRAIATVVSSAPGQSDNNNDEGEVDNDDWLINDRNSTSSSTKKADSYECFNVPLEQVERDSLVWAPCTSWFKGGNAFKRYWPAMILHESKGSAIKGLDANDWPIPDNKQLIKYINIYKQSKAADWSTQYMIVFKENCVPYWDNVTLSRSPSKGKSATKMAQQTLSFAHKSTTRNERWNLESVTNLENLVQSKFKNGANSRKILDNVKARMDEFLHMAMSPVDFGDGEPDEEQLAERAKDAAEQAERLRREVELQETIKSSNALVNDDTEYVITPDTWISYTGMSGNINLAQVVMVNSRDAKFPLTLTSNFPLDKSARIRVMATPRNGEMPSSASRGSRSQALSAFQMHDGKSLTLKTASAFDALEVAEHGYLQTDNGGGSKATMGIIDESDDDDEVEVVEGCRPRADRRAASSSAGTGPSPEPPSEKGGKAALDASLASKALESTGHSMSSSCSSSPKRRKILDLALSQPSQRSIASTADSNFLSQDSNIDSQSD